MRYGGGFGGGMLGGPGIIACIIGFLFLVALIAGITVLVIHFSKGNRQHLHSNSYVSENNALVILNERLAKGEVSLEEYNNIKLHLQK